MIGLYNAAVPALRALARIGAIANPKLRDGIRGRNQQESEVGEHFAGVTGRPRILIHCSSYGELEQAKPVITALRASFPGAHVHVTFFSPSGYLNSKNRLSIADFVSYLPEDSRKKVARFLDDARPDIVLFTRYDVWPNFVTALMQRSIPTVLYSATANFDSSGLGRLGHSLRREVYDSLSAILTVSSNDAENFSQLRLAGPKLQAAGDTRFDQVVARQGVSKNREPLLPPGIVQQWKQNETLVFVIGSAWSQDEKILMPLLDTIVKQSHNIQVILVPHEPTTVHVQHVLTRFKEKAIRSSAIAQYRNEPVIVVDTVGRLFELYELADISFVGGGFGAGVHNVLEPAVWGVPVLCGPNHQRSKEVKQLIDQGALFEVSSQREFEFVFWRLAKDTNLRENAGRFASEFVRANLGATETVARTVVKLLERQEEQWSSQHSVQGAFGELS